MSRSPDFDLENAEVEVIEAKISTSEYSVARQLALQVLYEVDATAHAHDVVIATRLAEEDISRRAARYLRKLVEGILAARGRIDVIVQGYAPEWPLSQVALVDRNILRIAVYEILSKKVPVAVAINEALMLADLFGGEGTPRFVNGVLGTLVNNLTTVEEKMKQLDEESMA